MNSSRAIRNLRLFPKRIRWEFTAGILIFRQIGTDGISTCIWQEPSPAYMYISTGKKLDIAKTPKIRQSFLLTTMWSPAKTCLPLKSSVGVLVPIWNVRTSGAWAVLNAMFICIHNLKQPSKISGWSLPWMTATRMESSAWMSIWEITRRQQLISH